MYPSKNISVYKILGIPVILYFSKLRCNCFWEGKDREREGGEGGKEGGGGREGHPQLLVNNLQECGHALRNGPGRNLFLDYRSWSRSRPNLVGAVVCSGTSDSRSRPKKWRLCNTAWIHIRHTLITSACNLKPKFVPVDHFSWVLGWILGWQMLEMTWREQ